MRLITLVRGMAPVKTKGLETWGRVLSCSMAAGPALVGGTDGGCQMKIPGN